MMFGYISALAARLLPGFQDWSPLGRKQVTLSSARMRTMYVTDLGHRVGSNYIALFHEDVPLHYPILRESAHHYCQLRDRLEHY